MKVNSRNTKDTTEQQKSPIVNRRFSPNRNNNNEIKKNERTVNTKLNNSRLSSPTREKVKEPIINERTPRKKSYNYTSKRVEHNVTSNNKPIKATVANTQPTFQSNIATKAQKPNNIATNTLEENNIVDIIEQKLREEKYSDKGNKKSALRTLLDNIFYRPKEDMSKVSVNIDGEKEFYNVLFRQNPKEIDLNVRKVAKKNVDWSNGTQNSSCPDDELLSASLENFLLNPQEHCRKRSFSQTILNDEEVIFLCFHL